MTTSVDILQFIFWSVVIVLSLVNILGLFFIPSWGLIRRLGGTLWVLWIVQIAFCVALLDNVGGIVSIFVEVPWWVTIGLTALTMVLVAIALVILKSRTTFAPHLFVVAVLTPLGLPLCKLARSALRSGAVELVEIAPRIRIPRLVSQAEAVTLTPKAVAVVGDAVGNLPYRVETMLGWVGFPDSIKYGTVGEEALHHLMGALGYKRLLSKTSKIHGIDGVYVKYSNNGDVLQIRVVDAKCGNSKLKNDQMTLAYVKKQAENLKAMGGKHAQTGALLESAMTSTPERIQRELWRFDLKTERITGSLLRDEDGAAVIEKVIWDTQDNRLRNILVRRFEKGVAVLL